MAYNRNYRILLEGIIASLGLCVFSYFIRYDLPVKLTGFAALAVPAYIIRRNLTSFSDFFRFTDEPGFKKGIFFYCIAGIFLGILLGVLYRRDLEISILPRSFHYFVMVAALIGAAEELVFRGFIQHHVSVLNSPFSIVFSTISHTGYKCCLFMSPIISPEIDIGFLALFTFIAGIIFGTIRHLSRSILPSLIAHVAFDIIVYAEYLRAPWWTW
jgi:membrane protease YdiL (CAAX protease family)